MKLFTNKKIVIITAAVLLLTVAVGTTLAFVFTNTDSVKNTFTPSKVACAVVENGSETENTGNKVDTGTKKTAVQIKNTGDTDAYIRVAVVVTWKNAENGNVYAQTPIAGTDYTNWAPGADWEKNGDYYYYAKSVKAGEKTGVLIDEIQILGTANVPDGCTLSVEIIASAIQANGMGAASAQDAWVKAVETTGN